MIIAGIVYFIIGIAYMNALGNDGCKGEWAINLLLCPLWPYFMLVRYFKHAEYISEQKRIEAHKKAHE
jgi:hypothetical protein